MSIGRSQEIQEPHVTQVSRTGRPSPVEIGMYLYHSYFTFRSRDLDWFQKRRYYYQGPFYIRLILRCQNNHGGGKR